MPVRAILLLTVSANLLSGCATSPRISALPPAVVARITAEAAAQVRRCYRAPKVMGEGRRIATRLHVRYAPDGSIIGVPSVVWQSGVTPSNQIFAGDMAQAAIESVVRCSPLRLPPELYDYVWNDFELTFSPAARG
jgi:hypothetical protein